MRLPIQYALTHPDRRPSPAAAPDLVAAGRLEFRAPDEERFPALRIARHAGRLGPRASAALIAADDVAVARFLEGTLDFLGIPGLLEEAVATFGAAGGADPDLSELVALDREVRAALASGTPGVAGASRAS
jgi:1-deoxy-D-xylulose-5-phosphate reductoisomerase